MLEQEVGNDLMKASIPFENQSGVTLAEVYVSLAELERDAKDNAAEQAAWTSLISRLEQDPVENDPRYWQVVGQGLYRMGRNHEALQALEKSIALKSETKPTIQGGPRWWFLTMALAKSGEVSKARQHYNALSRRAFSAPDTQFKDESRRVIESASRDSEAE